MRSRRQLILLLFGVHVVASTKSYKRDGDLSQANVIEGPRKNRGTPVTNRVMDGQVRESKKRQLDLETRRDRQRRRKDGAALPSLAGLLPHEELQVRELAEWAWGKKIQGIPYQKESRKSDGNHPPSLITTPDVSDAEDDVRLELSIPGTKRPCPRYFITPGKGFTVDRIAATVYHLYKGFELADAEELAGFIREMNKGIPDSIPIRTLVTICPACDTVKRGERIAEILFLVPNGQDTSKAKYFVQYTELPVSQLRRYAHDLKHQAELERLKQQNDEEIWDLNSTIERLKERLKRGELSRKQVQDLEELERQLEVLVEKGDCGVSSWGSWNEDGSYTKHASSGEGGYKIEKEHFVPYEELPDELSCHRA